MANEYEYELTADVEPYSEKDIADYTDTAKLDEVNVRIDVKAQTFTSQPIPPYNEGDMWIQGEDGDIMTCVASKSASDVFDAFDWEKASKYTDDTVANAAKDKADTSVQISTGYNGVTVSGLNGLQVLSLLNTLTMNATAGIEIRRNSDNAILLSLDASGNIIFTGKLSGVTGDFNGKLTASSVFIEPLTANRAELKMQSGDSGSPFYNPLYVTFAGDKVGGLNSLFIGNVYNPGTQTISSLGKIVASATNINFIGALDVTGAVTATDFKVGSDSLYNPLSTNLPLGSGITVANSRTPRYTKQGRLVMVEGEVNAGIAAGTTIGTLPVGFRPSVLKIFKVALNTGTTNDGATVYVNTDGTIVLQAIANATNTLSLCGISFMIS